MQEEETTIIENLYSTGYQRQVIKMLALNTQFVAQYGTLVREEYFENPALRTLTSIVKKYAFSYEKELDLSSLSILIDEHSQSRGVTSEVAKAIRVEAKNIYTTHIKSETFVTDQLVKFVRRQELKNALIQSVDILEKDDSYEKVLALIDKAVSIGAGNDDGMSFEDLVDLPKIYAQMYDRDKLVTTGLDSFDKCLLGGMAPGEVHVIMAPPKTGKCLAPGTEILMYDGQYKKIEDIKPGELVMGVDSTPRTVLGTNSGTDLMYEVRQNKGAPYTVNSEHVLSLKHCSTKKVVNIGVRDYLKSSKDFKYRHKGYKVGVEFVTKSVQVHPYFLGLWLGNGIKGQAAIANQNNEVVGFLEQYASDLNLKLTKAAYKNKNCYNFKITDGGHKRNTKTGIYRKDPKSLISKLDGIGVLHDKHIPNVYKINSSSIRLQLLAGLIDSDGYASGKGGVTFSNSNSTLAKDVLWLAQSLGFRATMTTRISSYKGTKYGKEHDFNGVDYRVFIWGDVSTIPCKVTHKNSSPYKGRDVLVTGIEIQEVGYGPYFGFELSGDRLFLLKDFTVTHNSSFGCMTGASNVRRQKNVFHITLELKKEDIAAKYAMNLTKMNMNDIVYEVPELYKKRIEKYDLIKPHLFINYWTEKTINTLAIRSWVTRIRARTGISPDLIIVDYDDLLLPTQGVSDSMYENSGNVYSDLKALADYFKSPIMTFAQPQREGWTAPGMGNLIGAHQLAHSAKKAHNCFSVSSLNFDGESADGTLFVDIVRRGESKVKIPLRKDLAKSMFFEP